jgi:hypothetical protein
VTLRAASLAEKDLFARQFLRRRLGAIQFSHRAFHLNRRDNAVHDFLEIADGEQLTARNVTRLRAGCEENRRRKLRGDMIRKVEVDVEAAEIASFLTLNFVNLPIREDLATGCVLDVRQRQEASITDEGAEIMEEYKGSPALDAGLLAAAQAVEHYGISRYGTLKAWAEQLGLDAAAELLQETLDEEEATDKALTEIAKSAINPQAEAA